MRKLLAKLSVTTEFPTTRTDAQVVLSFAGENCTTNRTALLTGLGMRRVQRVFRRMCLLNLVAHTEDYTAGGRVRLYYALDWDFWKAVLIPRAEGVLRESHAIHRTY